MLGHEFESLSFIQFVLSRVGGGLVSGQGALPSVYRNPDVKGVKRQGREADHSPATGAEVKKAWIYTSTAP
jgi:hypothetical protein